MVTVKVRLKAHAGEGASRPMKNYYGILGVAQTSDEATITAAFKALMQKLDSGTHSATAGKDNTKEFNDVYAVLKAYEVLNDPDARREYDAGLAVQFENRPQKLEKKRSVAIARGEALVQAPSAQYVPDGAYESPKSGKNSFIVALLVLVLLVGGSVMLLKADAASCTELFTAENYVAAVEPCTKLDAAARSQAERKRTEAAAAAQSRAKATAEAAKKYTPPVWGKKLAYPNGWFLKQKDAETWCGYRSFEDMESAIDRGVADGYTQASISFNGNKILDVNIIWLTETGDTIADDVYILDSVARTVRIWRTGRYIEDPEASVSYIQNGSDRFILDSASKSVIKLMELAGYQTYPLTDTEYRSIYSSIEAMPFSDLILKKGDISISNGCTGSR